MALATPSLRQTLRTSIAEGMLAEVFTACTGGAVLTGSALHFGASPMFVGAIVLAPQLAQIANLPAAWCTATFGPRRVALVALTLSRQVFWPLVVLPFLVVSQDVKLTVLGVVCALSALFGIAGSNAWTAWMGELVPASLRGRYFGQRTAACVLAGSLAALVAGFSLDLAPGGEVRGFILSGIALMACIAGAFTTWLLTKQRDVEGTRPFSLADAAAPLAHPSARRLLTYQLAWNGAIGLASGFFSMHMLKNLKMGFLLAALHGAALACSRMVACPIWGRLIDRYGSRPVLTACSFGICTLPIFYVFTTADHLWPFAIEAVLSGALWSGHTLAAFSLPLAITTREQRPYYLALSASAAGFAMTVATFTAGAIVEALPPQIMVGEQVFFRLQVLFVLSAFARFAAATLAPRLIEERARPVSELMMATYRATGLRLQRAFLSKHDDR